MRIIGRIFYAFAVAIFLIAAHNFGTTLSADKYFANEGLKIFNENGEDKYRFFYGSTGFHLNDPTYIIENNQYKVQFFEINKVFKNNKGDIKVEEYFYIIIDHPEKVLTTDNPQRFYMKFYTNNGPYTLRIHQFRNIPFSVVVNDEDEGLLDINDLTSRKITKYEIIDYADELETVISTGKLDIKETDLVIKRHVIDNYNNEEYLNSKGINIKYKFNATKYNYIYFIVMGGYLVSISLITYLLFFKKTKKKKEVN